MWKPVLQTLSLIVAGAVRVRGVAREATDAEYALFPRLFHLDDYESCLLKADALYCLGTFDILPDYNNRVYGLLKEYSEDVKNFNRTRLHRGYCVSERCPTPRQQCSSKNIYSNSNHSHCESNEWSLSNARRFERCVLKWSQKHQLQVKLTALQYCHTRQDVTEEWKVETPHIVFLGVVAILLMMNIVGTSYDVLWGGKKNKLLTSWSVWSNWRHLVGDFHEGDPRLAAVLPVEAARFILMLTIVLTHSGCIHDMLYLGNPRLVDQMSHTTVMLFLYNGHSAIQIFMMLSSFLLAQKIVQAPQPPSFWILAKMLIKRIVRISPMYLLVLGYAATWWPATGGGPQWPALVAAESAACRDRFWPLAFFIGNYVRNDQICLVSTWYLQVDMQLYIAAVLLTVWLTRMRRLRALQLLAGMFILSVVGTAILAYVRRWAPLFIVIGPELIRKWLSNSEVFTSFCIQPWSSVGAYLVGLFLALLFPELHVRGFRPKDHKWLIIGCQLVVLVLPMLTGGLGQLFKDITSREAHTLYLALERPLMTVLSGLVLFGIQGSTDKVTTPSQCNGQKTKVKGFLQCMFSSRALYPLGRMSLAVMLVHCCINLSFAAARPGLFYTSPVGMIVDFLGTACLSYLAALPLTLLLDIPAQQMLAALSR